MSSNCNCEWRLSEHNSNWQILAHNSCYLFALTIYIWAPPIEMCKSIRKTLTMKEVKQVDWVQSQTSFINDSRIQVTICKKKSCILKKFGQYLSKLLSLCKCYWIKQYVCLDLMRLFQLKLLTTQNELNTLIEWQHLFNGLRNKWFLTFWHLYNAKTSTSMRMTCNKFNWNFTRWNKYFTYKVPYNVLP